jgi:hypothetical protein
MIRRLLTTVILATTLLGLTASSAQAHSGVQSYLYLDVTTDELGGRVEMPFGDLRTVFGLSLDGDEDAILEELRLNEDALAAYVKEHFEIGADGERFDYEFTTIELLPAEGGYALVYFLVDLPSADVPRVLDIGFDPFFDDIDDRDALLLIANDWQSGVIDNGEEVLLGFDTGARERTIDLGAGSQWNNFTASIGLGVDHIQTGPDHILFVLVLLLPSVLVFTTIWRPVDTFGASLWRIVKIVSMFTVAHSITFAFAGLEILPLPPSRLVESVIAASIAITALHNLHPIVKNREWAIAFGFGLFHGMGFASLVGGLDVSQGTKSISLLGRNVGIEIGQTVVVLLLFPALFLLRRTRWYRPLFVAASIVLAIVAFGWMIERLFVVDLKVGKVVDPILEFPRSLLLVVVLTSAAAVAYLTERRAGRLLEFTPSGDEPVVEESEMAFSGSSDAPR